MRKTPQSRRSHFAMHAPWLLAMTVLFAVAGCRDREQAAVDAPTEAPAAPVDDADQDVPPATAPATSVADAPRSQGGTPEHGTPGYAGFGSARFGGSADDVRAAWGEPMVGGPGDPAGCYYLYPQPKADTRIAFMIENARFARLDVDAEGQQAPGGGAVGMAIEEIRKLYPGSAEYPHKYVEGGKTLRHRDASGSVVVFEVGPEGKVTAWHVGVPPQVDYVEGCG
ncbi:hypothetical protein [Lysobacter fragariae]